MGRGFRHPRSIVLERYRAGLLSGRRRNRVAGHLEGCAACRAVLAADERLDEVLSLCRRNVMPEGLTDQLVAAVLSEQADVASSRAPGPAEEALPSFRVALGGAFAALTLSVLLVLMPAVAGRGDPVVTMLASAKHVVEWVVIGARVADALLMALEPLRSVVLVCTVVTLGWGFLVMSHRGAMGPWWRRSA